METVTVNSKVKKENHIDEDYEKLVNLSLQVNRWFLMPIAAWPGSNEISWITKFLHTLVHIVCYSLILFLMVPCAVFTIYEVEDVHNKIKLSGPVSFCLMSTLKYYSLIIHSKEIRTCFEHIERDWRSIRYFKDRSVMMKNANFGRRLVAICSFFMYGAAIFYYMALPVKGGKVKAPDENLTFIPLAYPVASLLIDARQSPINEIFYSVQFLSGMVSHTITIAACSLAAVFAMHAYGQLEVLMNWLEHLVDGREDLSKDVDVRLAGVVEQHVRILGFLTLTEIVVQQIALVEILGCTLNMCLLGYDIIVEWDPNKPALLGTYFILLVSITFNIFILCYIGELVSEQCKKVGEVSYMTEWHRLPGKKSVSLILMITMSNCSIKLTAGNFFELSMTSFGDVVKTSLAYLNMLRTLTSS